MELGSTSSFKALIECNINSTKDFVEEYCCKSKETLQIQHRKQLSDENEFSYYEYYKCQNKTFYESTFNTNRQPKLNVYNFFWARTNDVISGRLIARHTRWAKRDSSNFELWKKLFPKSKILPTLKDSSNLRRSFQPYCNSEDSFNFERFF